METIKHECGLAVVRLRKPLEYYLKKYGTPLWGLHRLYVLLEKQHNRGQDGAGLGCIRLQMPPGQSFMAHHKVTQPTPPWSRLIEDVEAQLRHHLEQEPDLLERPARLKEVFPYAGELLMGHLRYATHSRNDLTDTHPAVRQNGWKTRNLMMAGNFNLTNVDQLIQKLIALGQHPISNSDTITVLERVGHFLDQTNELIYRHFKAAGYAKADISELIAQELDLIEILHRSAKYWDGGYVMGGLIGHGDMFVARDPWGIRPAFYFYNDEVAVVASERPAIASALHIPLEAVEELSPAMALTVKYNNKLVVGPFTEVGQRMSCSFERIYFSRGNDPDIYQERKNLGQLLVPQILEAIEGDLEHTVFSYIPHSSQIAFLGLLSGLDDALNADKLEQITSGNLSPAELDTLIRRKIRAEYVIEKDTKLRTFITEQTRRNMMASHVYDVSHGTLKPQADTLVCVDDSIVRGTTLRENILRNLARLRPRKIIIVSSAPQIRYPDCYGIDMSRLSEFIAFQAAIALLRKTGRTQVIDHTYRRCLELQGRGELTCENTVQAIYAPFTAEEISAQIAELLYTPAIDCPVQIIYQTLDNLRKAIPDHEGRWYFDGQYPTPGGNKVVNRAFINFYEGRDERSY